MKKLIIVLLIAFLFLAVSGQEEKTGENSPTLNRNARNYPTNWWIKYSSKNIDWYKSSEAKTIAENIMSWQSPEGGWGLMNTTNEPWTGDEKAIGPWGKTGTFVHATTNEVRFLAKYFAATNDPKAKETVLKATRFIFDSQTPTGGWSKGYPLSGDDYRKHNTFNDGAMENVITLLWEMVESKEFDFLDTETRKKLKKSYERGIECILKSQIVVNGKLTAWGQQHDRDNYQPRPGRTFEPVAITANESIGILKLLMGIENPSPEIIKAVKSAVNWINESKIVGYNFVSVPDLSYKPKGIDMKIVPEKDKILWARFYEIETNKPIFFGRDGVKKYSVAEIEQERRTGYAWYGIWGKDIEKDYSEWSVKWNIK